MEKVFDIHIHYKFEIGLPKTIEIFKKEFQETGTAKGCFLSLPYGDEKGNLVYRPTQNIKGLYLKQAFSPNFYAFSGLVYPTYYSDEKTVADDLLRQAEQYAIVGYDGMKMLEPYPSILKIRKIPIDSPLYDKYYAFMEEAELPILMHIANPNTSWDMAKADRYAIQSGRVYDESYPTKDEITRQMFSVMKKFPRLKLILAHWGFFSLEKDNAERFLGDYANTMLDVTPGGEQLINMSQDWTYWLKYIEKYRERILYGTDFYAFPDGNEQEWRANFRRRPDFIRQFMETSESHLYLDELFTGIQLDVKLRENIYWSNAERLLGNPKKVDIGYMREKAEQLLFDKIEMSEFDKEDLRYILRSLN